MPKLTLNSSSVIDQANYVPSPNCDLRPNPNDISLLVIHNISLPPGQFGGKDIINFFSNQLDSKKHPFFARIKKLKVSAHLLIDRQGVLTQFVPLNKRAWHAGSSCFLGKGECNDFAIGIELEGTDNIPYTAAQYSLLIEATKLIMQHYPAITTKQIAGHSDIAPGRKTDPGLAFDWPRYRKGLTP